MNIKNLKVAQKLAIAFSFIILVLVILSIVSYQGLAQLKNEMDLTDKDRYPKIVMLHTIKDGLNENARNLRNLLLLTDPEVLKGEYANIEESAQIIAKNLEKLDQSITSVKGRELIKELMDVREKFIASRTKFLNLTKAGDKEQALTLLSGETRGIQLNYFAALDKLITYQQKLMEESATAAELDARSDMNWIIGISAIAICISILLAIYISNSITRPLNQAVAFARRVAEGDLTAQIEIQSKDETGQLMSALQEMNQSLLNIVSQVRSGTDTIATASTEIAAGNMDLSSRTEEQASSLEETASSMEELTSTVKQNADNARQANQLASSASTVATRGGTVVAKVVDTMGSINDSSKKIVDIISVIDGIAFQTNILALNAAVEAARAGEQGRGFAVVASEVRTLAQRSAAAAKEIKHLIDDSVNKVAEGSKLVEEAGTTMNEIVVSVQRVSDVISEITAASQEQTSGIEQINVAIIQMDNVTQQNASLVEEAAAAAESMQEQARSLSEVVSVFKIDALVQLNDLTTTSKTNNKPQAVRASNLNGTVKPAVKKVAKQVRAAGSTMLKPALANRAPALATGAADIDWEEF
ncbi:methyl-accepting chemotaxis protein [Undibacterium fentianense]|uniref:MCP four helix bundle domain-containing protein n=1 Tax=Undibacterium fentianense TaxID=2828728 RepID=A0A941IGV9_9BURK|nr:methyl-accepting chemotaxis protein [Undibacterium fentianense]MBR7801752.1 MCP four helix bundle domain-containing protein [Undibacterium fentianense]